MGIIIGFVLLFLQVGCQTGTPIEITTLEMMIEETHTLTSEVMTVTPTPTRKKNSEVILDLTDVCINEIPLTNRSKKEILNP